MGGVGLWKRGRWGLGRGGGGVWEEEGVGLGRGRERGWGRGREVEADEDGVTCLASSIVGGIMLGLSLPS